MNHTDGSRYTITWQDKLASMSSKEQERTDKSQLKPNNSNIRKPINIYTGGQKGKKESNESSCSNDVPLCRELEITEMEIIEDLNPWKEPDGIDLTNLDVKNEQNSGKQDEPNGKRYFFSQEIQEKYKKWFSFLNP